MMRRSEWHQKIFATAWITYIAPSGRLSVRRVQTLSEDLHVCIMCTCETPQACEHWWDFKLACGRVRVNFLIVSVLYVRSIRCWLCWSIFWYQPNSYKSILLTLLVPYLVTPFFWPHSIHTPPDRVSVAVSSFRFKPPLHWTRPNATSQADAIENSAFSQKT